MIENLGVYNESEVLYIVSQLIVKGYKDISIKKGEENGKWIVSYS